MDSTKFSKGSLIPKAGKHITLEHLVLDRPCSLLTNKIQGRIGWQG